MTVYRKPGARGAARRRREERGDFLDTHELPKLHKIILHNVSNGHEPIGGAHDRFGALYKFLVVSCYSCVKTNYPGIRIHPVNHIL